MSSTGNKPDQLKNMFVLLWYPKTMKEVSRNLYDARKYLSIRYSKRTKKRISLVGYRKCKITGHNKSWNFITEQFIKNKPIRVIILLKTLIKPLERTNLVGLEHFKHR
jgi:hypothetical protein